MEKKGKNDYKHYASMIHTSPSYCCSSQSQYVNNVLVLIVDLITPNFSFFFFFFLITARKSRVPNRNCLQRLVFLLIANKKDIPLLSLSSLRTHEIVWNHVVKGSDCRSRFCTVAEAKNNFWEGGLLVLTMPWCSALQAFCCSLVGSFACRPLLLNFQV